MRRCRRELTPGEVAAAGAAVAVALLELDVVRRAATLLAYVATDNEIPTDALIASAHAAGTRVFLPRLDGDRMVFAEHHLGGTLRLGPFGIPEPQGVPLAADELARATAVLPLVAWDDAGGRLGRGGGHYDRAFAGAARPRCLVGLAYAFQQLPRLPLDPWDVRLDMVVSDDRGIRCWAGEPRSPHNEEGVHYNGIPGDDRRQPGDWGRVGGSGRRPAAATG